MPDKTIIDQLRDAIDDDPRSLYEIGKDAKLTRQSIGRFFRYKRGLTLKSAAKLAKALSLSLVCTERKKKTKG